MQNIINQNQMENSQDIEDSSVNQLQTEHECSEMRCESPEKETTVESDVKLNKSTQLKQTFAAEKTFVTGAASVNDVDLNNPTSPNKGSKGVIEKFPNTGNVKDQNFLDYGPETDLVILKSDPYDTSQNQDTAVIDLTVETSKKDESKSIGFTCACGQWFEKSVELAAHSRWSCKRKEQHVLCDICGAGFVAERGLRRHMNHVHGGMVPCGSCDMRFPNKMKLTKHWLRDHHKEGESLPCFVCGNVSFTERYELECHLLRHKYEKQRFGTEDYSGRSEPSPFHPLPHPPPMFTGASPPFIFPPHRFVGPRFFHGAHWAFPRLPPRHAWTRASQFPGHIFPPPPPPPPPPFPVPPPNIFSGSQDVNNDNPSQEQTSNEDPSVSMESSHQNHNQAKTCHDKEYSDFPKYSHTNPPHLHKHFRHCHNPHHGKRKWKKYLKHLAIDQVSRQFSQSMNFSTPDDSQTSGNVSQTEAASSSYKMACKFCNIPLDKSSISWHHKRECPVLPQHQCHVCDRVFRKRHHLIKHMHEDSHYLMPVSSAGDSESLSLNLTGEDISSAVSSLPLKMVTALNLTAPDPGTSLSTGKPEKQNSIAEPTSQRAGSINQESTNAFDSSHSMSVKAKHDLQCHVCKITQVTKENLVFHLQDHINRVTTIQKVREWRLKSSNYFLQKDIEGYTSDNDNSSVPSVLDSELSSITTTANEGNCSSKFSSLDTTASKNSSVWTKHRGRRGRRQKGEIFICDFCNQQFSFKKDLKGHVKSVHKDRTLECPVCKKTFKWSKRDHFFTRHVNSHYGVSIFNHKCNVCGKTFLEKCKLRAHMSLHNQVPLYQCSVCNKGYGNKSSLGRHERKHTGVRPHKCESCDQSFAEKRDLLRHSATHTGVAPFSCTECGRGFTLKTSLMTHMKRQHAADNK